MAIIGTGFLNCKKVNSIKLLYNSKIIKKYYLKITLI